MQSANWVSAENELCVVQKTEINEFGTGSNYKNHQGGSEYENCKSSTECGNI